MFSAVLKKYFNIFPSDVQIEYFLPAGVLFYLYVQ